MTRDPSIARQVWRRLELIHDVTYWSPETVGALREAGYKGYWMGYFAQRAAPLGPVGPGVVEALFYNFAPWRVRKAIPDAWTFAPPEAALAARSTGSAAALRRAFAGIDDNVETAASLARRAAESAPSEGRALFAANADLPWPDDGDPAAVLWHASTLLREHRGDGHVAALLAAGISGRQAHVLHVAAGLLPRDAMSIARDFDDAEWNAVSTSLAERGLIDGNGGFTDGGRAMKEWIEDSTDRAALTAYATLDDAELDLLHDALTPLARAVVAAGDIPAVTPTGVTLDD